MGRLHDLGSFNAHYRNRYFSPISFSMSDPDEEEEVDYDIIGDMPEEEPEEGNIDIEHQGWMRRQ